MCVWGGGGGKKNKFTLKEDARNDAGLRGVDTRSNMAFVPARRNRRAKGFVRFRGVFILIDALPPRFKYAFIIRPPVGWVETAGEGRGRRRVLLPLISHNTRHASDVLHQSWHTRIRPTYTGRALFAFRRRARSVRNVVGGGQEDLPPIYCVTPHARAYGIRRFVVMNRERS